MKNRFIYGPFNQPPKVLQKDLEAFRNFKNFVHFENPWLNNQNLVNETNALSKNILQENGNGASQNIDAIDGILKPFFTEDLR